MRRWLRARRVRGTQSRDLTAVSAREIKRLKAADRARRREDNRRGVV